jgi:UDP-N-acetylmuramoyl-L-alanyl-D-glutamate--2,6-diaminopimelate ligase
MARRGASTPCATEWCNAGVAQPRVVPAPPDWHSKLFTVGVTGTNGKTTTTAWIAAALRSFGRPVARATTVGFFLDDDELAVERTYDGFIAGMRTALESGGTHVAIELTSEALAHGFAVAWPCKVGVFTNLTHDHLDAHGTPEHYLASKAQLFVSLKEGGKAVLNASDPVFDLLRDILPAGVSFTSYAVPTRGAAQGSPDLVAESVDVSWRGTLVRCKVKGGSGLPTEVRVRAIGDVFAENALAALLGAVAAGVPPERARDAIAAAPPPPGRFEVLSEKPWVVVDYAHSPDALARTVATAKKLADEGGGKLAVVFGAGGKRDKAKRAPMGEAARPADVVVLTSDNPRDEDPADIARAIAEGLKGHADVRTELDRRKAITETIARAAAADVILVAGKGHETDQTIGADTRKLSDVDVARDAIAGRS